MLLINQIKEDLILFSTRDIPTSDIDIIREGERCKIVYVNHDSVSITSLDSNLWVQVDNDWIDYHFSKHKKRED